MKVYIPFLTSNGGKAWYAGSLTTCDKAEMMKYAFYYRSPRNDTEVVWHEIDIDPGQAMQSCDVTQVTADGEPQICADRREIEESRKG